MAGSPLRILQEPREWLLSKLHIVSKGLHGALSSCVDLPGDIGVGVGGQRCTGSGIRVKGTSRQKLQGMWGQGMGTGELWESRLSRCYDGHSAGSGKRMPVVTLDSCAQAGRKEWCTGQEAEGIMEYREECIPRDVTLSRSLATSGAHCSRGV